MRSLTKKCQNIAALLRLHRDPELKEQFLLYKHMLTMHNVDMEVIHELKSFFTIMIGYLKDENYRAVRDRHMFRYIIRLLDEKDYVGAAHNIRYLHGMCFQHKLDETAMYFRSTNWYRAKQYYYSKLLNI